MSAPFRSWMASSRFGFGPLVKTVPSKPRPSRAIRSPSTPNPSQASMAQEMAETRRTSQKPKEPLPNRLENKPFLKGRMQNLLLPILRSSISSTLAVTNATKKATSRIAQLTIRCFYYSTLFLGGSLFILGVLGAIAPRYLLEFLGFSPAGPQPNSVASGWMKEISRTEGHVQKDSLYSKLQKKAMSSK
ncbi:hypothetical protein B0J13DRAFT_525140 [Dactylonectria estremocensis]|uniref:Uncharacterized protein n=1 Tax=Dactylonectria estremocensis TaxID=1079267 RepID=A0A9P9ERE2_9HYPO|nr:hypothetical protein B0J13DRAFT_525140 [Dactylonectria estremocensis]